MPAPTYVLSDDLTLKEVHSRIESLCGQVEQNRVTPDSIAAVMKRYMLKAVTLGKGAFRKYFIMPVELVVTTSGGKNYVDLTGLGARDIVGISATDMSNLSAGDRGLYTECLTWEEYKRLLKNSERNKYDRYYYPQLGHKRIDLVHGSQVGATDRVDVLIERTPYIGFTLADIEGGTEKIDLPTFLVPFVEAGSAVECLRQAGTRESLTSLSDDFQSVIANLDGMGQSLDNRLRQQNTDK